MYPKSPIANIVMSYIDSLHEERLCVYRFIKTHNEGNKNSYCI